MKKLKLSSCPVKINLQSLLSMIIVLTMLSSLTIGCSSDSGEIAVGDDNTIDDPVAGDPGEGSGEGEDNSDLPEMIIPVTGDVPMLLQAENLTGKDLASQLGYFVEGGEYFVEILTDSSPVDTQISELSHSTYDKPFSFESCDGDSSEIEVKRTREEVDEMCSKIDEGYFDWAGKRLSKEEAFANPVNVSRAMLKATPLYELGECEQVGFDKGGHEWSNQHGNNLSDDDKEIAQEIYENPHIHIDRYGFVDKDGMINKDSTKHNKVASYHIGVSFDAKIKPKTDSLVKLCLELKIWQSKKSTCEEKKNGEIKCRYKPCAKKIEICTNDLSREIAKFIPSISPSSLKEVVGIMDKIAIKSLDYISSPEFIDHLKTAGIVIGATTAVVVGILVLPEAAAIATVGAATIKMTGVFIALAGSFAVVTAVDDVQTEYADDDVYIYYGTPDNMRLSGANDIINNPQIIFDFVHENENNQDIEEAAESSDIVLTCNFNLDSLKLHAQFSASSDHGIDKAEFFVNNKRLKTTYENHDRNIFNDYFSVDLEEGEHETLIRVYNELGEQNSCQSTVTVEAEEECNYYHLDLCDTQYTCYDNNGYWYDESCHDEPQIVCDSDNLSRCDTETDCVLADGYWYSNSCHDEPEFSCDVDHLNLCLTRNECENALGFWYDRSCHDEPKMVCDRDNLDLCYTLLECAGAGGHWYDNSCNSEPERVCDRNNLNLCYTLIECFGVGGHWYDNSCHENPEFTCDASHHEHCFTKNDCENALGFWYGGLCNDEPEIVCDSNNLGLCFTSPKCEEAGGYWYNDLCNSVPQPPAEECSADHLELCDSSSDCESVGGVWNNNQCRPRVDIDGERVSPSSRNIDISVGDDENFNGNFIVNWGSFDEIELYVDDIIVGTDDCGSGSTCSFNINHEFDEAEDGIRVEAVVYHEETGKTESVYWYVDVEGEEPTTPIISFLYTTGEDVEMNSWFEIQYEVEDDDSDLVSICFEILQDWNDSQVYKVCKEANRPTSRLRIENTFKIDYSSFGRGGHVIKFFAEDESSGNKLLKEQELNID